MPAGAVACHNHDATLQPQLALDTRVAPISYTLMVVGYALYLVVGFNAAMGRPASMRQVYESQGAICSAARIGIEHASLFEHST